MHKLDTTSGHLPYYKQIKEFYKKDIQDGVLAVGDALTVKWKFKRCTMFQELQQDKLFLN